ncbi:gfo/Idh/MocA family oxidoreductase [Maribellus comscasis]|uniref:Gfo/Idh/MocA family oxidoreductase n=1 Tax=Maribellus comscasis TaxID=2681766 RepID=A0A6I6K195_9BACT|nr:Gfo/Idh/MocA family oxidoreductase [Maribellus comscasis]QGY47208.1 gfo/Idh/MocA family oxidoreductase [Maribellus comscasis]
MNRSDKKINIAIVGLGFGAEFIPIYQNHPNANLYAICQRNKSELDKVGEAFSVEKRYTDYRDLLRDDKIDAVHINTPIHLHAEQSIMGLKAGKHVACTVPMATTVEECKEIVRAQRSSGKNYMMMETTVYSREFLHVKELLQQGKMGKLQFLRAAHHQEMAGWPGYWEGLPPMHYATHCVGPCLALAGKQAEYVSCFGSGTIDEKLIVKYNSSFAVETCHIKLKDSDLSAEISRSLFNTAREYIESFDAYGSKMSYEWQQIENEKPVVFTGEDAERIEIPDYAYLLPEGIRQYTTKGVYDLDENVHLSFKQGSGHGGSHPHLAHEFIMSIVENRDAFPNASQSANWTSVGILAHESAMEGGIRKNLPEY